jgi:vanillate O-demethylase monooxygenase subunit
MELTMPYLRNTWYVAAWSHEVGAALFSRKLLDEQVVFFRDASGAVAALADRCPHRFAPLRLGRLKGDAVECGYHGLQFDRSGTCIANPHGELPASANCRVRSYPVVERHGAIWIWPGEARLADANAIPDFAYITEPGRKTVFGGTLLKANYELVSDNLMDASHTQYVHSDLLGTEAFRNSRHEVLQDGDCVESNYLVPGGIVPAAFADYFEDPQLRVDYAIRFRWTPPALVRNNVSVTPLQKPEGGIQRTGSHFMTPETETTTHYFFAHTRNFAIDDPVADERSRRWQQTGLTLQDGPMIEAVQENMGTSDLNALRPFLFSIDAAAVRVRRVLARLTEAERADN